MNLTVHPLGDYIALLERRGLLAAPLPAELDREAPVALVSYDSRQVVPGTLFFCKGAHFKEEFLAQAQKAGAMAYVSQTPYPQSGLPCIQVGDMRLAMAPLADLYYSSPSGALKVIGITGTKGKSTTAYYMRHILDKYLAAEGKLPSGLISTIETYDGAERFPSHLTTPEPLELQRHFANGVAAGMEYLIMEVSSQALKYHRTLCTQFAAACFLNIGRDHISPIEHPDFEDYFTSKLKLFAQAGFSCVNLDCDHACRVLQAAQAAGRPVITFSRRDGGADVYASQVRKRGGRILFQVRTRRFDREFSLVMPGLFNVENALAAIALCQGLDIPEQYVHAGLAGARVPGRMEIYASADGLVTAIVDYAHNGMSFETLFRSARAEYPQLPIVTVFGCVGGKALDRRQAMGEAAGRWSDLVVLTEDHPAQEDVRDICQEVAQHVAGQGCAYRIEPNRGEAIRRAILDCRRPTLLIVAGKGAETYQRRGGEDVETPSDGEYVRAFLREYNAIRGLEDREAQDGPA